MISHGAAADITDLDSIRALAHFEPPRFPSALRARVQSVLTLAWNIRIPFLQQASAAAHAGTVLLNHIPQLSNYYIIDIAAGAGGPVPGMEAHVNSTLTARGQQPIDFLLTDIAPHLRDWKLAKRRSRHVDYISTPVDATAVGDLPRQEKKQCRMFNLAFHHLDDGKASGALADAVVAADAIVIFELQQRSISSLINIVTGGLLSIVLTPFYFWRDPVHILFTLLIPIVPFVIIFDGLVSSLRTRPSSEILQLLNNGPASEAAATWKFEEGRILVLPPFGYLHWFVGVRDG